MLIFMSQINQQAPKSPKQVKVVMTLFFYFSVSFSDIYDANSIKEMDIDKATGASTKNRSNKSGRIQKRHKKNSIVFKPSASKARAPRRK